ncbi:hypothetical protein FPOAC2_01950 [Fusarium poae]|uniref:Uncharacterized protein n=1 Tax=Fusarium poae TaxID=36050 RepID=A0A1B8B553_FUSPO|nr:hypothetical protein FPOAC1_001864 [Fusarium poae]KAG8675869.1 hypothetical protein FPOAC1_001864 [Fusarium poae]OBS27841.1 hypothetical protein FPOA_01783 [Fusarium poae]
MAVLPQPTHDSRLASRLWVVTAGTILVLFLLSGFYTDFLRSPLDYAESKANEFCQVAKNETENGKRRNCQDPYRRPGFLVIPPDEKNYRETQWMPFTDKFLDIDPASAAYPPQQKELIFNDTQVPKELLDGPEMPKQWMKIAVAEHKRRVKAVNNKHATVEDFSSMKDHGGLGWLWGRRVVEFGDSVDRYEAKYTCREFGNEMYFPKVHPIEKVPKGICEIPSFNLTFVVFHSAGGFTYRPKWFWYKEMRIIPFEERWKKLWTPHKEDIHGPNGRPDLLLWQNGLWDQRGFQVGGQKHHDPKTNVGKWSRQLVWEELQFYTARLRVYVELLIKEFPETPMMFRTLTYHQHTGMSDAMMPEMDRVGRAMAEKYGHEIFEWARMIQLLGKHYADRTHPATGALSWLWGNMVLEYLARSAGAGVQAGGEERYPYFEGWDACHEEHVGWGGR